ncbi:MAG TPA: CPBP family glutamic-type intramembrane protease [Terracidiphilus sp.]
MDYTMAGVPQTLTLAAVPPNSAAAINECVAAGRISWLGPLLLVSARTILWFTLQCLLALVLYILHRPAPFRTAGNWWMFYGTLSDLCCLFGIRHLTRGEGIRLRDIVGPVRLRFGRDIFLALGILICGYPAVMAGSYLAGSLVFGSMAKVPADFILQHHSLPLWATLYTLIVWWIVQSATEEMTYQGYALPRLQALTGRTWIALSIVGFWWAAQHCMIPFVPDWRYVAYRFLMFVPLLLLWMAIYLCIRRLAPLIFAHWPMDLLVAFMTGVH